MEFQLPEYSLRVMLPEIVLFVLALVVMTFDLFTKRKSGSAVGYLAMASLVITGIVLAFTDMGRGFGNMFYNDWEKGLCLTLGKLFARALESNQ